MADITAKMKLTLSDGRIIESNNFTIPQGPAGPAGADGANGKDGQQGPAGPLPNYVSFEKPTSTEVSLDGTEVTYTGVAEFEAESEMESGEYHQVLPSELIFTNLGTIFNVVVGNRVVVTNTSLNRTPILREKCFFITQSPTGEKEAWVGMAMEVLGQATSFQVLTKVVIDSVKKYVHSIRINGKDSMDNRYRIMFNLICENSSIFSTVADLKSYLQTHFSDIMFPCTGFLKYGSSNDRMGFLEGIGYRTSVYNAVIAEGYLCALSLSGNEFSEISASGIPESLPIVDSIYKL